jgi:hypothetical protein
MQMKKLTTLLLSFGLAGGLNAGITTGALTIPAMEEDTTGGSFSGDGGTQYREIAGWFEANDDGTGGNTSSNSREVAQDGAGGSAPTATAGSHWAALYPDNSITEPYIYTLLGNWETGNPLQYDIGFDLGDRSNLTFGSLTVQLVASNSGFTGDDGASLIGATGYSVLDSTATFTDADFTGSTANPRTITGLTDSLDATGIANGQDLWIRIAASGSGTSSLIDNLSVTAVPEPSTYALMGGFVALGLVMLRRRLRK